MAPPVCCLFSGFFTHHQAIIESSVSGRWCCLFVCYDPAASASKLDPGPFHPGWAGVSCLEWTIHLLVFCTYLRSWTNWCLVLSPKWFLSHHFQKNKYLLRFSVRLKLNCFFYCQIFFTVLCMINSKPSYVSISLLKIKELSFEILFIYCFVLNLIHCSLELGHNSSRALSCCVSSL